MMRSNRNQWSGIGVLIGMGLVLCSGPAIEMRAATAQEFRVYTRVVRPVPEQTPDDSEPDVIARSLTLFRAGRVFDWMPDVGEVTIFEPAHERFVIFNGRLHSGRRSLATTVTFDEITRLLDSARVETTAYATRLEKTSTLEARAIVEPLRFQLKPEFEEVFDPTARRLTLSSPRFSYLVQTAESPLPEAVEAYLAYTDWAARLNYVLGPGRLFPKPRLALNAALRRENVLPVSVQLRVDFDQPLRLEASHQFGWTLSSRDRAQIHHWETRLRDEESLKWVTFRDYQQAVLKATSTAAADTSGR